MTLTAGPSTSRAAAVPPTGVRWRFWLIGTRVAPVWRPWVAERLTAPGHLRRRALLGMLPALTVFCLPQLVLALLGSGSRTWWIALAYIAALLLALPLSLRRQDAQVARLLAYHGVTADGRLVDPAPAWPPTGLTKPLAGLLVVHLVVVLVGTTYVVSRHTSPTRCQEAPRSGVAAVESELGVTQLPGGPASAPLFEGARLVDPRRVSAGLDGVYYLGAHVEGLPAGYDTGPAVWRVIEPDRAFDLPARDVSAVNTFARTLTPVTGASVNSPDPTLEKVLQCARDARG